MKNGENNLVLNQAEANMLVPKKSVMTVTSETIFCRGKRWLSASNVAMADEISRHKFASEAC